MVLLIDTSILIDVLQNRSPFVDSSSKIWKFCEIGRVKGYVSSLSFANIVYVLRRQLNENDIKDVLTKLKLIFNFADLTSADLVNAAGLKWKDYEDAIQYVTAKRIHADYVVTRNTKDYAGGLKSITPEELLAIIYKTVYGEN